MQPDLTVMAKMPEPIDKSLTPRGSVRAADRPGWQALRSVCRDRLRFPPGGHSEKTASDFCGTHKGIDRGSGGGGRSAFPIRPWLLMPRTPDAAARQGCRVMRRMPPVSEPPRAKETLLFCGLTRVVAAPPGQRTQPFFSS